MKSTRTRILTVLAASGFCAMLAAEPPVTYPVTERSDATYVVHGQTISDPYAWLEESDTPDSTVWPKVASWIGEQNKVTFGYLESVPERNVIRDRLTDLWNFERFSPPYHEAHRYFFSRNTGLQKQSVLYMTTNLADEPTVLIDPNALREDGTMALAGQSPSKDGRYFAYSIAEAGSDWNTWYIRDLNTGKDLPDVLKWAKFSGASWTADSKGFFYNRYPQPKEGEALKGADLPPQICYHRVGTDQSEDSVIFEMPTQEWFYGGSVTDSGDYLVISMEKTASLNNNISYINLKNEGLTGKVTELFKDLDATYSVIDHEGDTFWVLTDESAPRRRVVAVNINHPEKSAWKEIIPQSADALQGVSCIGNKFLAQYLQDAKSVVKVFDLKGAYERDVDLPGIGTAGGFSGKRSDTETFYSFTSYTTPACVYRYDVTAGVSTLFKKPDVKFNPDDFQTTQVFYSSKDGTRVPMFITHRKGLALTGDLPTVLYGYGGFDISITPSFSASIATWLNMNGVYAVPNLRGGGEYGRAWHEAGTKTQKQNVFDDFIAAAEWLQQNGYSNNKRLAIFGGSNGGLLVGACMTQRPDLFGACLPAVGVLDMLKFHTWTVGRFWTADYGEIANEAEFRALYAYSPYHRVKTGACYPPTLITTGDHDDRVYPAHSFKFAAALQSVQSCDSPVLIRVDVRAGHGAGKPTSMRIAEAADQWAFLVKALDFKPSMN